MPTQYLLYWSAKTSAYVYSKEVQEPVSYTAYLQGTGLRKLDIIILVLITIFWAHCEIVYTGYFYNCFGSHFFYPTLT
jgi:hypothetical protein